MEKVLGSFHVVVSALFILPLAALVACSGSGSSGGTTEGVSFGGAWAGTWGSSTDGPSGGVTLELDQLETTVTGTATFNGHPCFGTGTVVCQVNGEQLSGHIQSGPVQMAIHGTCSGPSCGHGPHHASNLSGTYEILGGPCAGEFGTIQLTPSPTGGTEGTGPGGVVVGEVILIESENDELIRIPVIQRFDRNP
jgi:hypothetical protein